MKVELEKELKKQSNWQKKRKLLSWEDKLNRCIRVRNSVRMFIHDSKSDTSKSLCK